MNKREKISLIIILLLITIVLIIGDASYNSTKRDEAKIELLNEKLHTPSDIELLEDKAKWNADAAKTHLSEIESYKELIKNHQIKYEETLLRQRCYEQQILRKINNDVYDIYYCEDINNIQKFKTKK